MLQCLDQLWQFFLDLLENGEYELLGLVHALPSMQNARELLGPVPFGRPVRVMVTMPTEARADRKLLVELLAVGLVVLTLHEQIIYGSYYNALHHYI